MYISTAEPSDNTLAAERRYPSSRCVSTLLYSLASCNRTTYGRNEKACSHQPTPHSDILPTLGAAVCPLSRGEGVGDLRGSQQCLTNEEVEFHWLWLHISVLEQRLQVKGHSLYLYTCKQLMMILFVTATCKLGNKATRTKLYKAWS